MPATTATVIRWGPTRSPRGPGPAADLHWPDLRPDLDPAHWRELLQRLDEFPQDRWLLVLAADTQMSDLAVERLLDGALRLESGPALILGALDATDPDLSPLPPGTPPTPIPSLETLGLQCAWLGHGLVFDWHEPLLSAGLWRASSARALLAVDWTPGRALPGVVRCLVAADVLSSRDERNLTAVAPWQRNQVPPPIQAIDLIRSRWPGPIAADGAQALPSPPRPGTAVVLHVCHGWGGGSARFIRDLATADPERCHLLLSAHGSTPRQQFGEWLELRPAAYPDLLLEQHPLSPPIADTGHDHPGYRQVLAGVLSRWQVDVIMVSSLIGHDLAALDTGLTSTIVCHDYYPLWPELHCDFGDSDRRFDQAELERELAAQAPTLFATRDAGHWWRIRERFLQLLQQRRPQLVAPTRQVRDNWQRMAPALADLDWHIIGHGLPAWPDGVPVPEPGDAGRRHLRVLVPGRIGGGKGLNLLRPLAQALDPRCELLLLGAGQDGLALLGLNRVHLLRDYRHDQLPTLLAGLRPDLALLPATVAETFGYLLSELQSLGIPVLATDLGSYAERIEHGVDGLLVPAQADAIARQLSALADDPAPLHAIRTHLAQTKPRSSTDMAADYRAILPVPSPASNRAERRRAGPDDLIAAGLARHAWEIDRLCDELCDKLAAAERELEQRAAWGFDLSRQLGERSDWALSLEQELTATRSQYQTHVGLLDEQIRALQQAHAEQLQQIYSSRSWRAMAPMRHLARGLRGLRARVLFQLRRIGNAGHRLRLSLATRGLAGTLGHLRRRGLRPAAAPGAVGTIAAPSSTQAPASIPYSEQPQVSIIIPIHGKLAYTCACLASIVEHADGVAIEVIVVDDCSPDHSAQVLAEVNGLRLLRNPENLGFVGSCNAGAAAACGEWLVFLNNDTEVTAGWLRALLDSHTDFSDLGLVGARLVYPDGRLQEAGGLVFRDGSGWNYGRFEDPADPRYGYARQTDYCSGAAILIARELFQQLGGFDACYAPAYYEDTDLAFKVRASGRKVICQPAATVIHHEGVTSGTDTGSGIKRYQVVNQGTFRERWQQELQRQPAPGTPVETVVRAAPRGRILVIDATTPQPDQDSGSVRLTHILRLLRESGRHVQFLADNRAYVPDYTERLQRLGIEVLYHPWISDPVAWLREHGPALDAVLVCRHYIAANYLDLVRQYAPRARFIFDTVDLHYLREERAAALAGNDDIGRQAARTRVQEHRLIRASDVTTVVSPVEQELLRRELPGARIEVLSNVHPVLGCRRPWQERRDLFFVGGFQHPPNIDAVLWFCQEVMPRVTAQLPNLVFHVIGSRITPAVRDLASASVQVHGHVADLEPYLDGCRLAVAPLRYGAGVKGKVNMSMSYGQPVVATPMAVEGMHLEPGREVLVAAQPEDFAAAIVQLYQDQALWQQLSEAGLDNVRRHFSFEAARSALARVLDG